MLALAIVSMREREKGGAFVRQIYIYARRITSNIVVMKINECGPAQRFVTENFSNLWLTALDTAD